MEEKKIRLSSDNMDSYQNLKEEIKKNPQLILDSILNGMSFTQSFIAYNEEIVRYYHATYILRFSAKQMLPYLVKKSSSYISFDLKTKKIKTVNVKLTEQGEAIRVISHILKTEWFINFTQTPTYQGISILPFCSKTILEKIWSKKITNPEDLFKFYNKRILNIKNINWSKIVKLFKNRLSHRIFNEYYAIKIIDEFVINPDLFIEKIITKKDYYVLNDYYDYLLQIAILKRQSNVSYWSDKRFIEEHNKLTAELMEMTLESKNKTLLYSDEFNKYLPSEITGYFINNETLCFKEGKLMHHCLYTNYWSQINNLTYFAISINDKKYGRATVGIKRYRRDGEDIFVVDQIRGIRNTECHSQLFPLMTKWLNDNQELFKEMSQNQIVTSVSSNSTPLDFELGF